MPDSLRQPCWSLSVAALVVGTLGACSNSDGAGAGTGGVSASTGGSTMTVSGGTSSQGGTTGSGGRIESSGGATSSSGGTVATGGTPNSGGTTSNGSGGLSGGISSTGGVTSNGGAGGSGAGSTAMGGVTSTAGAGGGSAGTSGAPGSGGANTCPPANPLTGGKKYCSNGTGTAGGNYSYELWSSGTGTGCMTVYSKDATFSANWSGVDDLLARIGLQFDRTKTHSQLGTISADFAETKTANDGLVYVGIYGWTVNPLTEYYILDDWGSTKPADKSSDGSPRTKVGTITVDGDTYDVWTHKQVNKPAITGNNATFDQYFSVRQNARQCGHISISEHFTKWEGLGVKLGALTEAKLLLEAQDSSGTIDFTTAKVVVTK